MSKFKRLLFLALFIAPGLSAYCQCLSSNDAFLVYCINPKKQHVKLYWKDGTNQPFRNFANLRDWLGKRGQKLVFAMNGGMYKADNSPLGLYIDSGKIVSRLNKASASGNFYWKPNGVFYITNDNTANIIPTDKFKSIVGIKYATQSGPMLVIDGKMHEGFNQQSLSKNIRNGVGILENGQIIFVMSKSYITFYDFANFFLKAGCKNALYLDGAISKTYLPNQNLKDLGGDFGVIIAETSALK